jgi:predicted dehydrogenase
VVVDKPFTLTTAAADELIALAESRDRLLSVFQSRRWDGDFLTVRRCLEAGLLGAGVQLRVPLRPLPARPQGRLEGGGRARVGHPLRTSGPT